MTRFILRGLNLFLNELQLTKKCFKLVGKKKKKRLVLCVLQVNLF